MVQPLDKHGEPKGGPLVAADSTRMAGPANWCTTKAAGKRRWRSIPGSSRSTTRHRHRRTRTRPLRKQPRSNRAGAHAHDPGRVVGTITSTINHSFYDARKLLVVERTGRRRRAARDYLIADRHGRCRHGRSGAGPDEGNGARQVLASKDAPVRSVIVGIVDAVAEWTAEPPLGITSFP